MPKPGKRKNKASKPTSPPQAKLSIRISPLFREDLRRASDRDREAIKASLKEANDEEFFRPGKKFKILRKFKNRRIWYLRAGGNVRITAIYDKDGNLWLLSVESHDTLSKAPGRVFGQIKQLGL